VELFTDYMLKTP